MHRALATILPLLLLGSCGSPPKPPGVDESLKRPANSPMAVELQVCRNELQNTRVGARESGWRAQANELASARLSLRQALGDTQGSSEANRVFTVRFEYGSTKVVVPADASAALVDAARAAPLIVVRGRTDGSTDSLADSRIARERAAAVRDFLVGAGVDPARIRATHQPTGDPLADNSTPFGRRLNRRVEVELYRALPVAMNASATTLP